MCTDCFSAIEFPAYAPMLWLKHWFSGLVSFLWDAVLLCNSWQSAHRSIKFHLFWVAQTGFCTKFWRSRLLCCKVTCWVFKPSLFPWTKLTKNHSSMFRVTSHPTHHYISVSPKALITYTILTRFSSPIVTFSFPSAYLFLFSVSCSLPRTHSFPKVALWCRHAQYHKHIAISAAMDKFLDSNLIPVKAQKQASYQGSDNQRGTSGMLDI